jgi:hypothetical protein
VAISGGVTITNLAAFRRDLKSAEDASPRELGKALKTAGAPILSEAKGKAPVVTGTLAGGYKLSVRGTVGSIVNAVPYAMGAEYGSRGKWSGFNKYGPAPGRFAWKAVEDKQEEVLVLIANGMAAIVELHGWAH